MADVSRSDKFRLNEHGLFGDVSPSDVFRMNENGRRQKRQIVSIWARDRARLCEVCLYG
jgi:hypothetical protein